jgi:hypothetical protein
MSAPATPTTASPDSALGAPTLANLVRSECLRARSRRSLLWLTGLTLLGVAAISALMFTLTGPAGPEDLAAARDSFMTEQTQSYNECLDLLEPGEDPGTMCWRPTEADAISNAAYYVDPAPFTGGDFAALLGLAGGLATVVSLLVAASAGGADWGARSMGLLLSWEPRRLRVLLARLGVTLLIALVFTALAVGLAWLAGRFIAGAHGWDPATQLTADLAGPDLGDMGELALRWVPVGMIAAAAGYGVAMLTRSTGWAVGGLIAFGIVLGPVITGLWAWGSQWLPQVNAVAWLQGGTQWPVDQRLVYSGGEPGGPGWIWLSQGRALLTMLVMVLALLMAAAASLKWRDVD